MIKQERVGLPLLTYKTDFQQPFRFHHPDQFKALMLEILAHGASDIFVQPTKPVVASIEGCLNAVMTRELDESEVQLILKWAADRETAQSDILEGRAVNGRYELFDPTKRMESGARLRHAYRVNAVPVFTEGATSAQIVLRVIPTDPPTPEEVGLSDEILSYMTPRDGIVYVAGATGSGKTTSLAAVLHHILIGDTRIKGNIVTYEEPIEFDFSRILSRHSIIVQTQIPTMMKTFYEAIREAMRRAPKLIMLGELRDEETIRAAVEASLTGHTVFATAHANSVAAVMRRLISRFPESERATAIFDIVETTRFIMAQRLVPKVGGGRIAVREYLAFDDSIRERLSELSDMGKVTQVVQKIVEGRGNSFAVEGERLLAAGLIDEAVARDLKGA
jgi:defect-in-organelle-trafficking protein DotB